MLNKYYPPDFDPTKLPKLKRDRARQFVIRIMAPFSMRCSTCGEYIYKGRKFNSRMETVQNENYLGLRIYRFYIRCPKCISEITFKTDPENTDYTMELGATRNFQAYHVLQKQMEADKLAKEEEEANNPMKALENRTKESKREMESIEKLEELKDLNQRLAKVDHDQLISDHLKVEDDWLAKQEAEDEAMVRSIFGGGSTAGPDGYVKRILDEDSSSDEEVKGTSIKLGRKRNATDILTEELSTSASASSSNVSLPGPSAMPPPKPKTKLTTVDISTMVKKKKTDTESDISPNQEALSSKKSKDDSSVSKVNEPLLPELPAYKISLKKTNTSTNTKMKGNSLSMLGGYDSGSSDDVSD